MRLRALFEQIRNAVELRAGARRVFLRVVAAERADADHARAKLLAFAHARILPVLLQPANISTRAAAPGGRVLKRLCSQ